MSVPEGTSTPITHDIVLEPAQVVTGRVLKPDGTGACGALVQLRGGPAQGFGGSTGGDPSVGVRTFTRADGRYVISSTRPAISTPSSGDGVT